MARLTFDHCRKFLTEHIERARRGDYSADVESRARKQLSIQTIDGVTKELEVKDKGGTHMKHVLSLKRKA